MKYFLCGFHEAGYRALRTLIAQQVANGLSLSETLSVATHPAPAGIADVAALAASHNIPVVLTEKGSEINTVTQAVLSFKPDYVLSVYYRHILPEDLLRAVPTKGSNGGAFNFHPSLLPKHRGCHSGFHAIFDGDKETGVTVHRMIKRVDAGETLMQETLPIADGDTAFSLFYKQIDLVASLFVKSLEKFETGKFVTYPQKGTGSFHPRSLLNGGVIDKSWSRDTISRFIRAMIFPPLASAVVEVDGKNVSVNNIEEYERLVPSAKEAWAKQAPEEPTAVKSSLETVQIGHNLVGEGHPCFIIAEAGVNHNGNEDLAHALIDVAVEAGADAVKFQSFKAELLVSDEAPKCDYQMETTNPKETQADMLRGLQFKDPEGAYARLKQHCEEKGIMFMCTPFEDESVDLLAGIGVDAFKLASAECTNWQLIKKTASKGKPVILSTGMATMEEVEGAVKTMRATQGRPGRFLLMHCVACYPTQPEDANLLAMKTMQDAFNVPVGFSDHTLGLEVPIAAAALGARLYEKHFTLSRAMQGPDHRASLEPDELKEMVQAMRRVEKMRGDGVKTYRPSEENTRLISRRSIGMRRDVKKGEVFEPTMFRSLRPAAGILPYEEENVVGKKAKRDLRVGTILRWEDVE